MKNFFRICDRLPVSESASKATREKAKKIKELDAEFPGIKEESDRLKDTLVWPAFENFRKGQALNFSVDKFQALKIALNRAWESVLLPLKNFNDLYHGECNWIEKMVRPFKIEAISILEKTIAELDSEKRVNRLGDEQVWVETKGGNWPKGLKIRKISHNLTVIEDAKNLILACKTHLHGMGVASHDQIMDQLKMLEGKLNGIDFSKMTEEEISEQEFLNFREQKLL